MKESRYFSYIDEIAVFPRPASCGILIISFDGHQYEVSDKQVKKLQQDLQGYVEMFVEKKRESRR